MLMQDNKEDASVTLNGSFVHDWRPVMFIGIITMTNGFGSESCGDNIIF